MGIQFCIGFHPSFSRSPDVGRSIIIQNQSLVFMKFRQIVLFLRLRWVQPSLMHARRKGWRRQHSQRSTPVRERELLRAVGGLVVVPAQQLLAAAMQPRSPRPMRRHELGAARDVDDGQQPRRRRRLRDKAGFAGQASDGGDEMGRLERHSPARNDTGRCKRLGNGAAPPDRRRCRQHHAGHRVSLR